MPHGLDVGVDLIEPSIPNATRGPDTPSEVEPARQNLRTFLEDLERSVRYFTWSSCSAPYVKHQEGRLDPDHRN